MARPLLLSDQNDVMTDLGYDTTMTNIVAATRSALRMAAASLASAMQTSFSQAVVQDSYYVDAPSEIRKWDNFRTEFWLSQGFVNLTPSLVAVYGVDSMGLANSPAYTSDVSSAMLINTERGVCVDVLNQYYRNWVKITYTKGFPVDPDDASRYDLSVVPDWLQECSTILAKIALQSNPSLEDPAIKMDSKLLQTQVDAIMRPHLRYAPAAIRPILTNITGMTVQPTATEAAPLPDGDLDPYLFLPVVD